MEFGVFNSFWDGQPNHLPFLNLRESKDDPKEWNLQQSTSKLYSILKSNTDSVIDEGIKQLIESENWRPQLVAAISILSFDLERRSKFCGMLWDRLSMGSWVSPQILVVLSIIDSDFKTEAENIIDEGFTVNYSNLSVIDHHVSRGVTNSKVASEKVIAAITYLLNGTLIESMKSDEGASIAKGWAENLTELIQSGRIKAPDVASL